MKLAKVARFALAVALGASVAAAAACKKDESKSAPAAKSDDKAGSASAAAASGSASGSGSASASSSATASGSGSASASASGSAAAAKPAPPAAMHGFTALVNDAPGKAAGSMGRAGGALGDIFGDSPPKAGGGDQAPAAADTDTDTTINHDNDGDIDLSKITFPPPAAKGGDCGAVATRLSAMLHDYFASQLAQVPEDQRDAAMTTMMTQFKGELVKKCHDEDWSQPVKDCILTAMDQASLEACDKAEASSGGNAPPAPPPAAGNSCKDVGEHLRQLVLASYPNAGDDVKKELDQEVTQVVDACEQGQWSEETRACIARAASVDDADKCF